MLSLDPFLITGDMLTLYYISTCKSLDAIVGM